MTIGNWILFGYCLLIIGYSAFDGLALSLFVFRVLADDKNPSLGACTFGFAAFAADDDFTLAADFLD